MTTHNNPMGGRLPPIDFPRLADELLSRAHTLVPAWLTNGIERAGRWYVGDFDGAAGESANVDMRTGTWIDNGGTDEDKGGDLISLYARIRGLNMGQAARELMDELGWQRPNMHAARPPGGAVVVRGRVQDMPHDAPHDVPDDAAAGRDDAPPAPAAAKRPPRWQPVVPVPPHAPAPKFEWGYKDATKGTWVTLQAVRHWRYELDGQLLGYVARFERVNSKGELVKDTLPLTWCEDLEDSRGLQRWHRKQWADPRPLYLPIGCLSDETRLPVVLVEGEKCAEAGHQLLGHEFDFVTWPGGCKAWAMAQWSILMGREVILWPDCDSHHERLTKPEKEAGVDPASKPLLPAHKQPGLAAMNHIGTVLAADHGCTVRICQIPEPGKVSDGWDIADAIAQGWDAEMVRNFILQAVPFRPPVAEARTKAADVPQPAAGAGEGDDTAAEAGGWRRKLLETEKGGIKACRENVVLALDGMALPGNQWLPGAPEAAGVIGFNEFTNDVLKLKPTPWGTRAGVWTEVDELEMGNWLSREHWLPPMSRQTLEEGVAMVAHRHHFHPARQHFEALRGTWDGTKRLGTWLAKAVRKDEGAGDDDDMRQYLSRVGAWTVMAIIKRVMQPGCKFDYMLILEGGQGVGKSTLARLLGVQWFADTGLVLGDKDSYQNLQGVLVYEWGELDSLTRAEVTKVKQFVSSQSDRFRASFDRRPKDYPRQVVFIGTTNESHYLTDPTGNRRMWPVRVQRQIDVEGVRAVLPQLFAEALAYLDAGHRIHPTQDEQKRLFDPQQMERAVENALESAIRKYLYDEDQKVSVSGVNGSLVDEISLAELLTVLGISVDKQTAVMTKQASAALGRLGWERGRAKAVKNTKVRPWVYRRPVEPPEGAPGEPGASEAPRSVQQPNAGQQPSGDRNGCPF